MLNSSLYNKLAANEKPQRRVALANKTLTIVGYIAYPLLLVLLAFFDVELLPTRIAVPAAGFIVVSAIRYFYNAKRPYEIYTDRPPLVAKDTRGKSFPSRHAFCMFMIAFCWISWVPYGIPMGCVLLVCAVLLAICRVALGVHFTKDVVAGAVCAIVFSLLGYLAL